MVPVKRVLSGHFKRSNVKQSKTKVLKSFTSGSSHTNHSSDHEDLNKSAGHNSTGGNGEIRSINSNGSVTLQNQSAIKRKLKRVTMDAGATSPS